MCFCSYMLAREKNWLFVRIVNNANPGKKIVHFIISKVVTGE